jgi:hypothetical protein
MKTAGKFIHGAVNNTFALAPDKITKCDFGIEQCDMGEACLIQKYFPKTDRYRVVVERTSSVRYVAESEIIYSGEWRIFWSKKQRDKYIKRNYFAVGHHEEGERRHGQ